MPWYGWLLLTAGAFIALAAVTFRLLRASQRGRRFLALSTRGKLQFGRALLQDSSVPLPAKLMLFALVGYLAMPFDLIPDFIPVVGQLDDMAVIVVAIALLIVLVPREHFESALAAAEREQALRRRAGAGNSETPKDEDD